MHVALSTAGQCASRYSDQTPIFSSCSFLHIVFLRSVIVCPLSSHEKVFTRAYASEVSAVALSACLSEKPRYCVKTAERIKLVFGVFGSVDFFQYKKHLKKCWAHSPLRAAARRCFTLPFIRCRYCRTPTSL